MLVKELNSYFMNGQYAHDKLLNIVIHWKNLNQNTVRCHYISTRMTKIKKIEPNLRKDMRQLPYAMERSFQEQVLQFLITLNVNQPYNTAIPCLGIQLREMKTNVHKKPRRRIPLIVLFITTKNWKQLMYSSIGKWTNCVMFIL